MRFLQNITHMLGHWTAPLITSSYSTQNLLDCALWLGSVSTFMLGITASNILLKSFDYGKLLNPNPYPLNTKKSFLITWFLTRLLSTSLCFFPNTISSKQHLLFHNDCLYFFYLVAATPLVMMAFFPGKLPKLLLALTKPDKDQGFFMTSRNLLHITSLVILNFSLYT